MNVFGQRVFEPVTSELGGIHWPSLGCKPHVGLGMQSRYDHSLSYLLCRCLIQPGVCYLICYSSGVRSIILIVTMVKNSLQ